MAIEKQCANCGNIIMVSPSKLSKNNFCNRECYSKFHSKEVPTCICEICGKTFKGNKYNTNRFCSRECYNQYHNIKNKERTCPCCGKIFIARVSKDKYCSQECNLKILHQLIKGENHPNWRGGITSENEQLRKSEEYKIWQQSVYKRDSYCCQICKSKEGINAHHLYGWKEYPEKRFDINNGITLCQKCHIKVHQKYGWASKEKMSPDFLLQNKEED